MKNIEFISFLDLFFTWNFLLKGVLSLSVGLQDVQKAHKLNVFGLFSSMVPPQGGARKGTPKTWKSEPRKQLFLHEFINFFSFFMFFSEPKTSKKLINSMFLACFHLWSPPRGARKGTPKTWKSEPRKHVFLHTFIHFPSFSILLSDPKTSNTVLNPMLFACFWTPKKSHNEAQKRRQTGTPTITNVKPTMVPASGKQDATLSVFVVGCFPLSSFLHHYLSFSLFLCSRSLPFSLSPPPPPPPLSFLFSLSLSPSFSSLSLSLASLLVRLLF